MVLRKLLVQHFLDHPPDIFVGIDAPDFNLSIESRLKAKGITTIHYVSPTVWAWRERRILKIAKATNLVLGIFPFEAPIYEKYGVPYHYVGHRFADTIDIDPDTQQARNSLSINLDQNVLAVLPGSRKSEVDKLLPVFLQTAELLSSRVDNLRILIPVVNKERKDQIEDYLANNQLNCQIQIVIGHSREVMVAADVVLMASGTAALEAMLCKRPMVVAYLLNGFTHFMMKWLYKPNYFALPNILANEALVPELLQQDVNPYTLLEHLLPMFDKPFQVSSRFWDIHKQLKRQADVQAATAVCSLLEA
jgi:lipid-A-disaccharide synthase